jgi:hypothetical protein
MELRKLLIFKKILQAKFINIIYTNMLSFFHGQNSNKVIIQK